MSGPENTFIRSVHKHLPVSVYFMKNHNVYCGGVPDVWYSAKADLWVEYKFIEVPVRDATVIDIVGGKKPPLSVLQQEWLRARTAEGRRTGVIIGSASGGVWLPKLSWSQPITALTFRNNMVDRKSLAKIISEQVGGL